MPMKTRESRRTRMGKESMGTKIDSNVGRVFDEAWPQVKSGKRLELLVNNVCDIVGLRQSVKESSIIADFCTTITVSLLPEEVLVAAAKKLYEYFAYKLMVISYGTAVDVRQTAFYPGDIETSAVKIKSLLHISPDVKTLNIRGFKCLGLPCPNDYVVSGKEKYSRLPFENGSVSFVTDTDLNQVFSPSFFDKILGSFVGAMQNAHEYGRVKEESMRDGLTGLFNRRVLDELLELEDHKREGTQLSLLVIDLDNFKKINDSHGHPAGDLVLQTVGKVLRDNSRGSDLVVRNGGEEFAVLLPSTSATVAFDVGERMRKSLENTLVTYNGCKIQITGSVGIAHRSSKEAFPVGELVAQADQALYQAKKCGKNRVCFYSASPVLIGKNKIPPVLELPEPLMLRLQPEF